jgi:tRNA A-37 threonylcarbamoyl transferase component Bud32
LDNILLKFLKRTVRVLVGMSRGGPRFSLNVIYILILPSIIKVHICFSKIYLEIKLVTKLFFLDKKIKYLENKKEEYLKAGDSGYKFELESLGLPKEKIDEIKDIHKKFKEVVIGEIDQDGFILSYFGRIADLPTISEGDFVKRIRNKIFIVSLNQIVGVRKQFSKKDRFINEIITLQKLSLIGCNVPAILDIDFRNLTITVSYINGSVLREELTKNGAILLDREADHIQFKDLNAKEVWLKRIINGRKVLNKVVNTGFIEQLYDELRKIHSAGVLVRDIKYGNVIIEKKTGSPYFVDFDSSIFLNRRETKIFKILFDYDIRLFNLHFGTRKLTYRKIRERIKNRRVPYLSNLHAPVYFGYGLRIGNIADANVGYGRWNYILKNNLPDFKGKRILDLGSNNFFNGLQMLKYGASEVIGLELSCEQIAMGEFVKEVYEWVDNRKYNFRIINLNMKDIQGLNLGKFDIITAFCSIYYLDEESIKNLIQYISSVSDIFVAQCNEQKNISRVDPYQYVKASVDYNSKIISENGFLNIKIIYPYLYSRPLIIARK